MYVARDLSEASHPITWVNGGRVRIDVQPGRVVLDANLQQQVDAYWHEVVEFASPQFFRGPVLTMTRVTWEPTVVVEAAFTDYAHFLYSRRHRDALSPEDRVRPIFAAVLPITQDGLLVVCKMGSKTARPGRIQCIGGTAIESDVVDRHFRAEVSARREMREEIGIGAEELMIRERGVIGATVDPDGGAAVVVTYDVGQSWQRFRDGVRQYLNAERNSGRTTELEDVVGIEWGERGLQSLVTLGDPGPRYLRTLLIAPELRPEWPESYDVVGQ